MARYRVVQDGSGWKVTKNGRRHYKKRYQTKQAALDAAKRAASTGDSVQGQRVDGTWGEEDTKDIFGPRGDTG
jgi:hypothetical protein